VTSAAAADSRKKIRGAARSGAGELVVTGCWSTLAPEKAAELPKVKWVIPNQEKENLVFDVLKVSPENFDVEPVARHPIPGVRLRTRAFIKVQDGCDNRCTFCVTTVARGPGRSRQEAEVLEDVHAALRGGVQEVVLTGVHLGSWGQDFNHSQDLRSLVRTILSCTSTPRLRLSSLEPWDLDETFFELWGEERLARQLHLPLQSGCGSTLRRMARKISPDSYARLVQTARSAIPDLAVTTDIIVGFPGESDREFEESLTFVRDLDFAGGHVFTYSARQGTAAAEMPNQVPHAVRKARSARMRAVIDQSTRDYRSRYLGRTLDVLWESATALGPHGWSVSGLTDNYLRVKAQAPQQLWNQITPVKLTALTGRGLSGEIQTGGTP
jgi:threonylcarbamoyladenosine tRNA methylthiotransferase MtaB